MQNSNTFLVTGGAGFIGANLVRTLLKNNVDPLAIHIIAEKNVDLWRLKTLAVGPVIHEINLENFEEVRALVHAIKPRTIFHLASYGGMPTQIDQKTIYNVNFLGTINLLNVCKEVGFDCFINTGSSSEYGRKTTELHEEMLLEPVSDYAVAKSAATQFCLKEALFNNLPIYTVRPFAVYGDYEMASRLIPTILVGGLLRRPINLSAPHFVRDYIYVQDLVDLYLSIAEKKPLNHFIFNGGTGLQSSIFDVVTKVQTFFSYNLNVVWNTQDPRPWEPTCWVADCKNSLNVLDWRAQHSLAHGLEQALAWFDSNLFYYTQYERTEHVTTINN